MGESRAELIFHPLRMRILQALLREGPATPGQLREALGDVPPASLYRHLNRLAEGGVLEVVEERPVRGVVERVFAVAASGGASLSGEDLAGATREDHRRYFGVFLAALLGEFERYLAGPAPDLEADRVGYRQFPLWLSDEEMDEMLASMNALLEKAMRNEPRPDRRRRVLTRIVIPSAEEGTDER